MFKISFCIFCTVSIKKNKKIKKKRERKRRNHVADLCRIIQSINIKIILQSFLDAEIKQYIFPIKSNAILSGSNKDLKESLTEGEARES